MSSNGISNHEGSMAALDRYIAPGLRLWMLIALVSGILLVMVVIVCCFMRIRIPRTKRQIDLIAAKRKMRKKSNLPPAHSQVDERSQPIVMNTARKQSVPSKNNNRRERQTEDIAESVPLVHKSSVHASTTV